MTRSAMRLNPDTRDRPTTRRAPIQRRDPKSDPDLESVPCTLDPLELAKGFEPLTG